MRYAFNSSGTKIADYTYDAWGNEETSSTSTWAKDNPVRYNGQYYDTETGMYYLRARYYDPQMSRFISEDAYWNINNMIYGDTEYNDDEIKIPDVSAILQSSNLYMYGINNPIKHVDPSGYDAIWITNESAVEGLGHTSLLLEDENGNWYYFYWGSQLGLPMSLKNVEFELIDDPSALESLAGLNQWINENTLEGIDKKKNSVYTSATYIEGDFSKSVEKAKDLRDKWYAGGYYDALKNNCMQVSTDLILAGDFDGKWWKAPLLHSNKQTLIPNKAKSLIELIFGNSSFTK